MSDVEPGQRIDDFEILGIAGRGGMGVVYRARQVSLERTVAFKLIAAQIVGDPDYLARFAREARVAAAVEHPHVVSVYGAGRHGDRPYIAMQWIDGTDLRTVIDDHGPMEPERACTIAAQLASALEAIHEGGLLHRDLKPANVLLRRVKRRDHIYLTDFGIAKFVQQETAPLTRTGQFVGTPGYIAPESLRGAEVDSRSDIYAMGCMLFEFLAGERPFAATSEIALYWAHANHERPALSERRPHVGERFDAVLAQAMAINPQDRFETAVALADAMRAALESGARRLPAVGDVPTPVTPVAPGTEEPATPATPAPSASGAASPTPVSEPTAAPVTPTAPADVTPLAPPPAPVTPVARPPAPVTPTAPASSEAPAAPVTPVSAPPPRGDTAPTRRAPPATPPGAAPRSGVSPRARGIVAAVAVGVAIVVALIAGGAFSGSDGGGGHPSAGDPSDARADVVSVLRRYEQAFRAPGVARLRALLTPDVTRVASEGGSCQETTGRAAVLADYDERSAARTSYALPDLSAEEVDLAGSDSAQVTTRFTVTESAASGVTAFSLARRPEGWRITRVAAVNC